MKKPHSLLAACVVYGLCAVTTVNTSARAAPLDRPECVAGAKPGGGFDLTCKLAQAALRDARLTAQPMRITYMPGGIGAVVYNTIVAQRPAEAGTIIAFSSGSLLNIAQGKFGKYSEDDVRWLAAVATDYGALVVHKDSPYRTLKDLSAALRANPAAVVFGVGGTAGSQDWMKAALTVRAAGVSHKSMRFVAFEGGGEAITALQAGLVQVYSGDASEAASQIKAGANIRVLAVMSARRLPGMLADVPTAKEQGLDIDWPVVRGFYMGPKVSDADFRAWSDAFGRVMPTPEFTRLVQERGLYPFFLTGPGLDAYIKREAQNYRKLAADFGLPGAR